MNYQFENKWISRLGYAVLLVLLLFSFVFYLERSLFVDIAFQSFHLLRTETPKAQVYRFGAIFIQFFPWLAMKFSELFGLVEQGGALKSVLMMYSLAYPIFFLLVYTLIVKVLKNEWLGLVLVMLLTFTVFESFYWPVSELWQGLAMLLVFFAFVLRYPNLAKAWQKIIVVVAVPFILFYHPLVLIPFVFCWLFFYLQHSALRHPWYYAILLFLIFSLSAKSMFFGNWYDNAKQGEFVNNIINYFPNYFAVPAYEKFLTNSIKFYYAFPLMFFALSIYYIRKKYWLKLALVSCFCLGYIFIIHLGSPNALYRFYVEVSYIPLMLFVGVAFCFDVFPQIKNQRYLLLGLVLAFLIRLNSIYHAHNPFTDRLDWLSIQLEKVKDQPTNRFIMLSQNIPNEQLIMTWGVAYETLLLSSLEHPDSAKTIWITNDLKNAEGYLDKDNYFLGDFNKIPIEDLPEQYFNLGKGKYVVVD